MQTRKFSLLYLLPFADDQHRLPHGVDFDEVHETVNFLMGMSVPIDDIPRILQAIKLKARPVWLVLLESEIDTILNVLEPGNYQRACALIMEHHNQLFDIFPLTATQRIAVDAHVYVPVSVPKRARGVLKRFLAWLHLID
jgi:hypothetical protein